MRASCRGARYAVVGCTGLRARLPGRLLVLWLIGSELMASIFAGLPARSVSRS